MIRKSAAAGRRWRRSFAALLAAAAMVSTNAQAWGPDGHKQVGAIADALLVQHPNARSHLQSILGIPLAAAGPWADCVKSVEGGPAKPKYKPNDQYKSSCGVFETKPGMAEMEDYARRNWNNCHAPKGAEVCHNQYHYADIPLARQTYRLHDIGALDQNVTEAIRAAILVLKGKPAPAPFNFSPLPKRDALLMLAHLVGDLHQPLHVGAVYLDAKGTRIDPPADTDDNSPSFTRGGNFLIVGPMKVKKPRKPKTLHSEWDSISGVDRSGIVEAARKIPVSQEPVESWAAEWATDSLAQSRAAFTGISFGKKVGRLWPVRFDNRAAYLEDEAKLKRKQLEKAGAHLAQIMVAIWPDS